MNTITRGVRNAFRNNIRTVSIVVILGLSIGLALAMVVARGAVQDKITSVKSTIGNTITITPAGARGFQGGGEALTTAQLAIVSNLPNITGTTQTLSDRLTTENTNLVSATDAGSLGQRAGNNSGVGFAEEGEAPRDAPTTNRVFSPPLIVTGTDSLAESSIYGGSTVTYTAGQALDASSDKNEAVVGKALAEKNKLTVGSTFTAYSQSITVTGIYDAGNTFANAGLIMPLKTIQRLSEQADSVTSATITINSIDNVDSAVTAIEGALGSKADVLNSQDTAKEAVTPLESVRTISTFSLMGSVMAGAGIILLTMVMIVRERRREIGVYKAIGASNIKIMSQFAVEAVTLTLLAMIAGVIIGSVAARPLTNVLVNNSTATTQTSTQQTSGNPNRTNAGSTQNSGTRAGGAGAQRFGNDTLTNARVIQTSVGWSILVYAFVASLLIAIIGSAIPAFLISKIRPAEVMRAE